MGWHGTYLILALRPDLLVVSLTDLLDREPTLDPLLRPTYICHERRLSRSPLASPAPTADGRCPEPFSLASVLRRRPSARLPFSSRPPEPFCGGRH